MRKFTLALFTACACAVSAQVQTVPFSIVPTVAELDMLSILDNNNDEFDRGNFQLGVWNYDQTEEALVYIYSNDNAADDYVFLPLIKLDNTDKLYNVTFDVKVASSRNPESMEVCFGKSMTPSELTTIYASGDLVNDENYESHTVPMGVSEAGDYYIAIKATSRKAQFKLYVKNISVTLSDKPTGVPAAPTQMSVRAGYSGALTAEVTVTVPDKSLVGAALAGNVTVTAVSAGGTDSASAAPGSEVRLSVPTMQGDNSIMIKTSNSLGDGGVGYVNVFTGVDIPHIPVVTATASEDNMSVHLEWEADTIGLRGGYVAPEGVTYTVSRYIEANKEFNDGEKLAGVCYYDYALESADKLTNVKFMITAENAAGRDAGYASAHCIIGTPYQLPVQETLSSGKLSYEPLSIDTPTDEFHYEADFRPYNLNTIFESVDSSYIDVKVDHENVLWAFLRYGTPGKGMFVFPKVSTLGVNQVKFKMGVYINDIFPETKVYASGYGVEPVELGTITSESGEGWTDLAFVLPTVLADRTWVNLYFVTDFTDIDKQNVFIDRYYVTELLDHDIEMVDLDGPVDAVNVGETAQFIATVQNVGRNNVDIPSVLFEVVNGAGDVVASETVSLSVSAQLGAEEKATLSYFLPATADMLGDFTVRASVVGSDDNADNDMLSRILTILKGQKPIVDNLKADGTGAEGTVTLSWSKPDIKLTGLDEFEDYEPFYYGNYIGMFKNIDGDKKRTYSFDQSVFDGVAEPKAFMVINPEYLNNKLVQENYTPHSGNQYLVAFCPNDGSKADDWLISPEVKPMSVVSFYVNIVSYNDFAEKFEFCYSTTTNNPEDFEVLATESVKAMQWQGKAYMLPEGAKYFAIHYISADVFGLMIDDIDFTPLINEKSDFSYNIYEDDVCVATGVRDYTYVRTPADANREYTYNVTTVVDGIEYHKSNSAVAKASTDITDVKAASGTIVANTGRIFIDGFEGEAVNVCLPDGSIVFAVDSASLSENVAVRPGIYIVRAGTRVAKVMVR